MPWKREHSKVDSSDLIRCFNSATAVMPWKQPSSEDVLTQRPWHFPASGHDPGAEKQATIPFGLNQHESLMHLVARER
jgi:hypothetical protein